MHKLHKILPAIAIILIANTVRSELVFMYATDDASGYQKHYYETTTLKKSADGRYVTLEKVINYERPWKANGMVVKSIKSQSTWDCKDIAVKPGTEKYYSEYDAKGIGFGGNADVDTSKIGFLKLPIQSKPSTTDIYCKL